MPNSGKTVKPLAQTFVTFLGTSLGLPAWWPWPWPWFSPYPTGHNGPHSDAIRVCQELPPLLPPRWTPIFRRSLLTTPLQFALGRPGPPLYPGTCQYSACCGMRWWSIRKICPSQQSHLSLSMSSMVCCPVLVLTSILAILSFHEVPSILLPWTEMIHSMGWPYLVPGLVLQYS